MKSRILTTCLWCVWSEALRLSVSLAGNTQPHRHILLQQPTLYISSSGAHVCTERSLSNLIQKSVAFWHLVHVRGILCGQNRTNTDAVGVPFGVPSAISCVWWYQTPTWDFPVCTQKILGPFVQFVTMKSRYVHGWTWTDTEGSGFHGQFELWGGWRGSVCALRVSQRKAGETYELWGCVHMWRHNRIVHFSAWTET